MSGRIPLTLVCGALVAACGSSSPSTNNPPSYSQLLSFSKCMRAEGVSNYPDPSTSGAGLDIHITPSMGINPQAPAFQAAQKSCRHLLPSGQPSAQASAQAKAQLLRTAECMRAHGITDFPDPRTGSLPTGGNVREVTSVPGAFLAIPSSINTQSPAFTQAAAACSFGSEASTHQRAVRLPTPVGQKQSRERDQRAARRQRAQQRITGRSLASAITKHELRGGRHNPGVGLLLRARRRAKQKSAADGPAGDETAAAPVPHRCRRLRTASAV